VGYRLILLIIVIALAGRHACSVGPSLRSKQLVVGMTGVLAFAFLRWPEYSFLIALLLASIGVYIVLHQIVMSWQRELAEADRAPQRNAVMQPHKEAFPSPASAGREGS
jgi:hypothetical protein